jgi:Sel1 repeat
MTEAGRGASVAEKTEWDDVSAAELEVAAKSGNSGAQYALGKKRQKEPDAAEAARWFRAAAEQGHAEAQNDLGVCFYNGVGVDRDVAEAAKWYRKAADQGYATAQLMLGMCFYDGGGVDEDFAEAASWFRKAADQGYAPGCNWFGVMLMDGKGVARNCDEALCSFRKSSATYARDKIASIEQQANDLASETAFSTTVERIRAGDSVCGTMPVAGNTLLHTAAMHLALEPVSLLIEHPLFDDLVVRTNTAGQLARDVVGIGEQCSVAASDRHRDGSKTTVRVIASALSCRRSTRAACLLWCLEQQQQSLSSRPPSRGLRAALPPEVGEWIARFVVSPRDNACMLRVFEASSLRGSLVVVSVGASIDSLPSGGTKRGSIGGTQDDIEEPQAKRSRSDP